MGAWFRCCNQACSDADIQRFADDVAPRLQAKGILKAVNAHADSLILGATFAEANTLVQTVLNLMQVHSQQKIIVILDQVRP